MQQQPEGGLQPLPVPGKILWIRIVEFVIEAVAAISAATYQPELGFR
jgi:hypothetical protein